MILDENLKRSRLGPHNSSSFGLRGLKILVDNLETFSKDLWKFQEDISTRLGTALVQRRETLWETKEAPSQRALKLRLPRFSVSKTHLVWGFGLKLGISNLKDPRKDLWKFQEDISTRLGTALVQRRETSDNRRNPPPRGSKSGLWRSLAQSNDEIS